MGSGGSSNIIVLGGLKSMYKLPLLSAQHPFHSGVKKDDIPFAPSPPPPACVCIVSVPPADRESFISFGGKGERERDVTRWPGAKGKGIRKGDDCILPPLALPPPNLFPKMVSDYKRVPRPSKEPKAAHLFLLKTFLKCANHAEYFPFI